MLNPKRSKVGESATNWEISFIEDNKCPSCGGNMIEGASGGGSINLCCEKCFQRFNIGV